MRIALTAAALVLVAALLTGMGKLGGIPDGKIPRPQVNIYAHLIDRAGVATELSRFSMEGKVSFEGRYGAGDMSILFRDLQEVSFGQVSGDEAPADLLLKTGRRVKLRVPKSAVFSGETGYGAYQITAENIDRMVFR